MGSRWMARNRWMWSRNRSSSCVVIPSTARYMKWDYDLEDPHRDARGFRAKELLQDTDESAYYEIDKNRPLSFEEIKSDLVLSNGARFYNDHAHPEYSTPECTTLREIVAQDKAGERILAECARRRNPNLPTESEVRLYKNNTDFRRSQLRLPRQLPDAARRPMGPHRRGCCCRF